MYQRNHTHNYKSIILPVLFVILVTDQNISSLSWLFCSHVAIFESSRGINVFIFVSVNGYHLSFTQDISNT